MPLPVLVGLGAIKVAAVVAGAVGAVKGGQAIANNSKAKEVDKQAKSIVEKGEDRLKSIKNDTHKALENLGREKITVLSTSISDFVHNFEKIKNIDFQESAGIDELKNLKLEQEDLMDLKESSLEASSLMLGGATSLGSGALAAFGAYSGVQAFGAASTGTAIAGLKGVAATNATLAWLGGGALAAGGKGIAGGMVVLGGLVAGPALAVGGIVMSSQAKKRLNDAYNNLDEAKVLAKEMDRACIVLKGVKARSDQTKKVLQTLNPYLEKSVFKMNYIIEDSGTEWLDYSQNAKEVIFMAAKLAQTIKVILDTPLLKEDGTLSNKSAEVLKSSQQYIDQLQQVKNS